MRGEVTRIFCDEDRGGGGVQELGILFQESIFFVKDLKSPKKSGRFDTSGSSVALFVAEILCALDAVLFDRRTNQRTRRF